MPAVLTNKSARQAKELANLAELEAQEAALNLAENEPVPSPEAGNSELPSEVVPDPKPEPIVQDEPEPKPATPPVETDWKHEAETWKKRKGDADAALAPFQQVAAHEKKRAEALETKLQERDTAIGSIQQEIRELKALISSITPGASTRTIQDKVLEDDTYSPEIQELVESFPEVAKVSSATAARAKKEILDAVDERLKMIEGDREARKKEEDANKARAHFEAHHKAVSEVHPDVDEIYRDAADVLAGWASDQEPEYLQAVKNPLSVSPRFFTKILTEFKAALGRKNGSRKPGNGDIAVRAKSATQPSIDGVPETQDVYLTEDEFRKYPRLVQNAINAKNYAEVKRLEEGFENTARRKENE